MGKIKGWKKVKDNAGIITWRSEKDPKFTIEIVSFKSQRMKDDFSGWGYGYNAKNGKGLQNSPHIFNTKKEAMNWAINYMKNRKY